MQNRDRGRRCKSNLQGNPTSQPNFNSDEREVLLTEVSRRDKVEFAKIQGQITAASKEKAWGEVARLVSAVGVGRSADEAKKKWSSMKSDTKQKASACRRDQQATGGGPGMAQPLTADEGRILSVMGEVCVSGVRGGIDTSDTAHLGLTIIYLLSGLGPDHIYVCSARTLKILFN